MNRLYQTACFILPGFTLIACSVVSPTKTVSTPNTPLIPISSATATIFPTSTETAFFATPTFQPEIAAEVATLDAIVTDIPELGDFYDRFCITYGNCAYVSDLGLSPNKEWAVFFNIISGSAGLSVVNVDNKKQWNISYFDITGMYGGTVKIEHWSNDGYYLYVSPQTEGSGGLAWFWRDYIQLIRIDLIDGTWVDTKMGSSYSFSPDEGLIAYRREQNVVIHELQTGQERTFTVPAEYGAFGRFVWSLNGKQIILIGSSVDELQSDDLFDQANGFTLFLLDTENMKAQAIIEKDKRYLYPLEWQAPNIVLLERLYQVASDGSLHYDGIEKYKLDLETNDISKYESP